MKAKGFTLVELLVTIAIIAVLAVVAYPLYNNYVKNARLSEAHQAMMDNAQALERHYANHANFKKSSTQWVDLPITQTPYFCSKSCCCYRKLCCVRGSPSAKCIFRACYPC